MEIKKGAEYLGCEIKKGVQFIGHEIKENTELAEHQTQAYDIKKSSEHILIQRISLQVNGMKQIDPRSSTDLLWPTHSRNDLLVG